MSKLLKMEDKDYSTLGWLGQNIISAVSMTLQGKNSTVDGHCKLFYEKLEEFDAKYENEAIEPAYREVVVGIVSFLGISLAKNYEKLLKRGANPEMDNWYIFQPMKPEAVKFVQSLKPQDSLSKIIYNGVHLLESDFANKFKIICDLSYINPEVFMPMVLHQGLDKEFLAVRYVKERKDWNEIKFNKTAYWHLISIYNALEREYDTIPSRFKADTVINMVNEYIEKLYVEDKDKFYQTILFNALDLERAMPYLDKENTEYLCTLLDKSKEVFLNSQKWHSIVNPEIRYRLESEINEYRCKRVFAYLMALTASHTVEPKEFFHFLCADEDIPEVGQWFEKFYSMQTPEIRKEVAEFLADKVEDPKKCNNNEMIKYIIQKYQSDEETPGMGMI